MNKALQELGHFVLALLLLLSASWIMHIFYNMLFKYKTFGGYL